MAVERLEGEMAVEGPDGCRGAWGRDGCRGTQGRSNRVRVGAHSTTYSQASRTTCETDVSYPG